MSLPRHEEIYRSDGPDLCRSGAQSERLHAPTYRLDEFPAGYSLAGCAPAEPASASPAEEKFTMKAAPQPTLFQRMSLPSENVLNVPSRNVLLTESPWKGEQARASGAHRGDTPADTLS